MAGCGAGMALYAALAPKMLPLPACAISCACTRRARSMPDLLQALAAQEEVLAEAEQRLQSSRTESGEAEAAWREADAATAPRPPGVADALAGAQRQREEALRLGQERDSLACDDAELEVERQAIEAATISVADETEQAALVETARGEVTAAGRKLDRCRAQLAEADAAYVLVSKRRQVAGASLERAATALEEARAGAGEGRTRGQRARGRAPGSRVSP